MKLLHSKKAEMGVGTLIIFIAMLLVAAVAAGVLIQTAGSLQEKALSTGQQAKGQIATNVRIVEISASNGENGTLHHFEEIMKLAPGSDPIKIGQSILTFNTYDDTATLKYRGTSNTIDNSHTGYETFATEVIGVNYTNLSPYTLSNDLDEDGMDDIIYILASGDAVRINISGNGTVIPIDIDIGVNVTNAGATPKTISLAATTITDGTTNYGTIAISGLTDMNFSIAANTTTIVPANTGTGYFAVEYLQQGSNFVNGNLQRGDVIKVYYESLRNVAEDEELRINFIPKIGTATLSQFVTPEVISTERVYLYP